MQNITYKKKIFLFIFSLLALKQTNAQTITNTIFLADSLYNSKKYTEALKLYENNLNQSNKTSPKNLLKMARINEGSEKLPEALYYLSLYYNNLRDETVIPKTISIAENHHYLGWEYNDINFLENVLSIYRQTIVLSLFALLLLIFGFLIYRKFKQQSYPVLFIFIFLISISTILIIELSKDKNYGIILHNNALIMASPSAGGKLIEVSNQGHKIEIVTQNDIWTKIKWNNKSAYIRSNNLIVI